MSALFYGDYFARSSKRGGAWMSSFRDQENLTKPVTPLIVNNCNFNKGEPALLSFDEAKTLFHEFGHALHGLLSQVRFPRLSGTNVATDFVELPSQIYEHWLEVPETLERFAVHAETGKPMPKALLEKLNAARNFNQGFATVESCRRRSSISTITRRRTPARSTPQRSRKHRWKRSTCRKKS